MSIKKVMIGCATVTVVGMASLILIAVVGVRMAISAYDAEAGEAIAANKVVIEHIGPEPESVGDDPASGQMVGFTEYVYHVKGAKGDGTVYANFTTDMVTGKEKIDYGFLETEGKRWNLLDGEPVRTDDPPYMAIMTIAPRMEDFREQAKASIEAMPAMQDYIKKRDARRAVTGLYDFEKESMTEEEIAEFEASRKE